MMQLENLNEHHAEEMYFLLNDVSLYQYIGGNPIGSLEHFKDRYKRLSIGHSNDGSEEWINWIIRIKGQCVGYVQATIKDDIAYIAWMIGKRYQNKGYARAATRELILWLAGNRTKIIKAKINNMNEPSKRVAMKCGMINSNIIEDNEVVWIYNNIAQDDISKRWLNLK
jgi:RimJ/RimL family protein N-acetyltransferase